MHTIRVVLVGDSGVGKSALVTALQNERPGRWYGASTQTVTSALAEFPQQNIRLQLWDFPGAAHRRTLTKSFYRHTNVVCFVYACDRPEETLLDLLRSWIPDAKSALSALDGNEPVGAVVIGTKVDVASKPVPKALLDEVLGQVRRVTGETPPHLQVNTRDVEVVRSLVHTISLEDPGSDYLDTIDMTEPLDGHRRRHDPSSVSTSSCWSRFLTKVFGCWLGPRRRR